MVSDSTSEDDIVQRLQAASPHIKAIKEICRTSSISFGVVHEGRTVYRDSIGLRDVESNLSANSDTAYRIASCTKMLTATALALLVRDGMISWDDTIQSHIPDFHPAEDPEMAKLATIKDACMHATGLANPVAVMLSPGDSVTIPDEDYMAMINALPTSNNSGQRFYSWWYYSNAAFGMLAKVIESVTERKFSEFLRERILEPLGMEQTLLSKDEFDRNSNVAHSYVLTDNHLWTSIDGNFAPETCSPLLACLGIRSSVNDLLAFFSAVLESYHMDIDLNADRPPEEYAHSNSLRGTGSMWEHWWTRPWDDGFDNDTAYLLGWFRTTMPSAAVGSLSYNFYRYHGDDKPYMRYILGKDSTPRMLYGHNGIANGSVAAAYIIPETKSAIVALSNAADAGDAAESTVEVLLQALFDLQPHIDIVGATRDARDRCLEAYEKMISDWHRDRDVSKYNSQPDDYCGSYVGLGTSTIHIIPSGSAAAKLAVTFGNNEGQRCDLEPYNCDALSFLPLTHDELIKRTMIDWDYYKVGILEFVRKNGIVVGLWWQWDEHDYPGLWVKEREGITKEEKEAIVTDFGSFRKPRVDNPVPGGDVEAAEIASKLSNEVAAPDTKSAAHVGEKSTDAGSSTAPRPDRRRRRCTLM